MSSFCKLADPKRYSPCKWEFSQNREWRENWIGFFQRQFRTILRVGVESAKARGESEASAATRSHRAKERFFGQLAEFAARPGDFGPVTVLTFDKWRDAPLREEGFYDPFIDYKNAENAKVLPLLPGVCRKLDALSGLEQVTAMVEGIFAGNIFDMGVEETAKAMLGEGIDFFRTRQRLPKRPWMMDDFDALAERLLDERPYRKAVVFVDNAGADFMLGMAPFMRWLARRGTRVVLAANELPTLNDMSIGDVRHWWPRIVEIEPSLAGLPIEAVSSGTREPLLDLGQVSDELNQASADADLVVLEGMGRGVESNLEVRMSCDCLNVAMVKDAWTAQHLGGKVFDVVCRFTRPIDGLPQGA
jgi:type II pantothenate kinase